MKRKLAFLLALLGILALVFGLIKFIGGRSSREGELRVDSVPTASIFLDSKHLGRTPFREKVPVGEYTIKIVPESTIEQLASWEGKITVGHNLLTYVNSNLSQSELTSAVDVLWLEKISSKKSELAVTTNPDGATVLIDDETKGTTPLTISDLSPEDHSLSITSPGFASRSLKIKTTAGYKLIAALKLALSPSSKPSEEATSSPTPTPSGKLTPTVKATPTKAATSSATTPDPAKPFVIVKETPTGFLRVRSEPSTAASESARVNPGEKYHLFDEQSGWYEIAYDGTNKGWISGTYAEKVE